MRIHIKTTAFGLVLIAIGIGGVGIVSERSSWHEGTATVQRVTKQCEMTATERHVVTKTTYTATIDCDDVEVFELVNADKTWRVAPVYTGEIRVARDGTTTEAEMKLTASKDHEPTRGDTFAVLQDPNNPEKVAMVGDLSNNPFFAGGFGVAGDFLCWLGFGLPGLPRRKAEEPVEAQAAPEPAVAYAYAPSPQPANQPAVTDYSRARISQQAISSPRKSFGKRGA
jgi:hypothetical protein